MTHSALIADATGVPVQRDVGRCSQQGGDEISDSMLCHAEVNTVERHFLIGGRSLVPVINTCLCTPRPQSCQRAAQYFIYYPDTPFERSVDVGRCAGNCKRFKSCKPSKNSTVVIDGPSGEVETVQVIDSCQCAEGCYRMEKMEIFYTQEMEDGIPREKVQAIDVGECAGECSVERPLKCILSSPDNPSKCLMSLTQRRASCFPLTYKTHNVHIGSWAENRTLLSIQTCGCR